VTSRVGTRLSARPLPLSLVGARVVGIAAAPGAREPPVPRLSAGLAANPLRVARGGLRREGLTALGTSATRGHCASVAHRRILAAFPAIRWITLRPPRRARSPGPVGHNPAAKWIRATRPLKTKRRAAKDPFGAFVVTETAVPIDHIQRARSRSRSPSQLRVPRYVVCDFDWFLRACRVSDESTPSPHRLGRLTSPAFWLRGRSRQCWVRRRDFR
jgi:hypothetical protein